MEIQKNKKGHRVSSEQIAKHGCKSVPSAFSDSIYIEILIFFTKIIRYVKLLNGSFLIIILLNDKIL